MQEKEKTIMYTKKKVRIFGVIMCAVMMFTSMAVYAGTVTQPFGGRTAQAKLVARNGNATAYTTGSGLSGFSTQVRTVGLSTGPWSYGTTAAYADAVVFCEYAESYHSAGGDSTYLSVSYG